jgi:DNA-binding response OmpR family regulator
MSSLREPIPTPIEQTPGPEPVAFTLAVVSKSLLSRQSIARKLGLAGITVIEHQHFDALFHSADEQPPEVVLIDTAEQELGWKALVSLLKIFSERSRVVLLTGSMTVDQTVEAADIGVAAVFIKPFKEEEHSVRILDLLNSIHGIVPERLQPRLSPWPDTAIRLEYLPTDDWLVFPMEVRNISQHGAQLRLPYEEFAGELQPGSAGFPAVLMIGYERVSLRLRVMHREGGIVGVAFDHLGAGGKVLESFFRDLRTQAFGACRNHRRW